VHETKLLPPLPERHPHVFLKESLYGSLAGAANFAELRQRSRVAWITNEYFGDPECPGIGRIWKLQRKHPDRLQLVEDYVYQNDVAP
jgi:hypothetical protein